MDKRMFNIGGTIQKIGPYLIISFIIFVFNILSIWGFNGLIVDDQSIYSGLYTKTINDLAHVRNIFHVLFMMGIAKIAVLTSIYFARLVIVLLFSIPIGWFIYYFAHHHYHLKKHASIAIAVLPLILPNELQVPTYLIGSYMLLAILAAFFTICLIIRYLKQPGFPVLYFFLTIITYYVATECSELIASMLPVFLFLVFIRRDVKWKHWLLGAFLTFIAVRKSWLVVAKPHGMVNSVQNNLSFDDIIYRISHVTDVINPFLSPVATIIMNFFLFTLVLSALITVFKNPDRITSLQDPERLKNHRADRLFPIFYFYLFPLAWILFSTIPFLFFSQSFTSRYMTVASIGMGFLVVVSIGVLLQFKTKRKGIFVLISVLIIAVAGFSRQLNFDKFFEPYKDQYRRLTQLLDSNELPLNAQIITTTFLKKDLKLGNGVINNSYGVYQNILKRKDVHGQIMMERNFYDPFRIYKKPYLHRNADLDTLKNTFLFRCFDKDTSHDRRLHYALRWADEKSKDSPWSIYYSDDEGKMTNLVSGRGYPGYEAVADSLSGTGIARQDIMFGGFPTREDSLRLNLADVKQ